MLLKQPSHPPSCSALRRAGANAPNLALETTIGQPGTWRIPGKEAASMRLAAGSTELSALLYRMKSRRPSSQIPPLGGLDRGLRDHRCETAAARASAQVRLPRIPRIFLDALHLRAREAVHVGRCRQPRTVANLARRGRVFVRSYRVLLQAGSPASSRRGPVTSVRLQRIHQASQAILRLLLFEAVPSEAVAAVLV